MARPLDSLAAAPSGGEHDATRRSALVRFRHVFKSYDGHTLAAEDLDFGIGEGEFLTLLGPSGSGKTTTLMMLAGFETPSAGEIEFEGRPISRTPSYRREFGVVFQDYALFPHMTVAENVAFPLTVRRRARSAIAADVAAALETVRLSGFDDRLPSQLSGGQQQRVALARALVYRPRLILMDEPLGALDRQLREQMQLEIMAIQRRLGIAALYVTHDQQEALTMSDRIAVFNRGRILQLGTPAELYETPQDLFVAEFLGENNRLPGVVQQLADGSCMLALAAGGTIVGRAVGRLAPSGQAAALVRPERLVHGLAAEAMANRLDARVESVLYQGDHIRALCGFGRGGRITVLQTNRAAEAIRLRPGEPVTLGWDESDCRVFAT